MSVTAVAPPRPPGPDPADDPADRDGAGSGGSGPDCEHSLTPRLVLGESLRTAFPLVDRPPPSDEQIDGADITALVRGTALGQRLLVVERLVTEEGLPLRQLVLALDDVTLPSQHEAYRGWLAGCTVHAAITSGHLRCDVGGGSAAVGRGPRFAAAPNSRDLGLRDAVATVDVGACLVVADPLAHEGVAPPEVSCRLLPVILLEAMVGRDELDLRVVRAGLVRELRSAFGRCPPTGWLDAELRRLVVMLVDLGWCRVVRPRRSTLPVIASTPLGIFGFVMLLIRGDGTTGVADDAVVGR